MQKKILENIIGQLNEKKREHEMKIGRLNNLIEFFKDKADLKTEMYKVEVKSYFSKGNVVLIKRGPIEEILKEAEKKFKTANKEKNIDKIYKISILIVRGKKTIKIPISEEIVSALVEDTL